MRWLEESFVDFLLSLVSLASVKFSLATILTVLLSAIGQAGEAFKVYLILFLIDYALGTYRSIRTHTFKWKTTPRKLLKFGYAWITASILTLIDDALALNTGGALPPMSRAYAGYLCICEGMSSLDHLNALGADIPQQILKLIKRHKNKYLGDKDTDNEYNESGLQETDGRGSSLGTPEKKPRSPFKRGRKGSSNGGDTDAS